MRSHFDVMGWWVVFCKVISQVFFLRFPKYRELILVLPRPKPIVPHVDGFSLFGLYNVVNNSTHSEVVRFYWCWGLRVAKGLENIADADSLLEIGEQGTDFGLGSRCKNVLHNTALCINRSVGRNKRR